jgi:ADP-ribosylglycohydrolase
MRAPVLALFFAGNPREMIAAARVSAKVTHAHPLGIEGAVLVAIATHALLEQRPTPEIVSMVQAECVTPEMLERMQTIASWIKSGETPGPRDVARKLGNGITAPTSCPTALYIAIRHLNASFEAMMEFIIACRGDVDTIGAMAGAYWGIVNGAERLPSVRLESRELLVDVATRLFRRHQ